MMSVVGPLPVACVTSVAASLSGVEASAASRVAPGRVVRIWSDRTDAVSSAEPSGPSCEPSAGRADISHSAGFSARYDRSFRRVFHYVNRRVPHRKSVEDIVTSVLTSNLDLLLVEQSEGEELTALKVSSDREILRWRTAAARTPVGAGGVA